MSGIAGQHRFTLTDAQGKPHDYVLQEFNAQEGLELMCSVVGLGLPSIASAITAGLRNPEMIGAASDALSGNADDSADDEDRDAFSEISEGFDLSPIGREMARALLSGKVPKLLQRLLGSVFRDGERMDDRIAFNQAYRANYGEAMRAALEVCVRNGFFLLPTTTLEEMASLGRSLMKIGDSPTSSESTDSAA